MEKEVLKKNLEQMDKVLTDMRVMCVLLHRTAMAIGINEKEDSYLHTFLESITPTDIDDAILGIKLKLEKVNEEKLYVVSAEVGKEIKVEEVKVLKCTDKLYRINMLGYSQVNKNELGVIKQQNNMLFTFVNDVDKGKQLITGAIKHKMESIRDRLKEYSDLLVKMEELD